MPETVTPKVWRLVLQFTYSCPQSCVFCSQSRSLEEFGHKPLTLREVARILAMKRRDGVEHVTFAGGGEPTLHRQLTGMLQAAKRLGLQTMVATNGWRLAEPGAEGVLDGVDELCLSVHGDTAELHEALTRTPGGFARLLAATDNARRHGGPHLATYTTVTRANWPRLEHILRFVADRGVRTCYIAQVLPAGRAAERYGELAVALDSWKERIPRLVRVAGSHGLRPQFIGLPLCIMGRYWRHSYDAVFAPTATVGRSWKGGALEETLCLSPAQLYRRPKAPICRECGRRDLCSGVDESCLQEASAIRALRPFPESGGGRLER